MIYGITAEGFNKKDADTIKTDLENRFKSVFGDDIKTTGDSVFGQIIGIVSDELADTWEVAEVAYYSPYRETATGISLSHSIALLGKSQLTQQKSTVPLRFTNDSASPVDLPAGTIVRQSSNNVEWQTLEDIEVPASSTADVSAESILYGPYTAAIDSIDIIVTPISGISAVTNTAIAITGRIAESDSDTRKRIATSLVSSEGGTGEAVANRIREEIEGVTYATWRENRTDETVSGLKPHSYEFTVIGGDDQEIAELIWTAKGGGIDTNGTEDIIVNDEFGTPQTVYFNRATSIDIYFIVNLTVNSDYPVDGDDQVKALLVELGKSLQAGDDVKNWVAISTLNGVPGIDDVTILQGTSPTPVSSSNTSIAGNEKANILSVNIMVNS